MSAAGDVDRDQIFDPDGCKRLGHDWKRSFHRMLAAHHQHREVETLGLRCEEGCVCVECPIELEAGAQLPRRTIGLRIYCDFAVRYGVRISPIEIDEVAEVGGLLPLHKALCQTFLFVKIEVPGVAALLDIEPRGQGQEWEHRE